MRLALRTQQIIAYETGVADTIDPLAGSYYVESLTDALETQAQDYIDKIDALGGSVRAIEQGYIQREIQEAAYRYQTELDEQKRIVVGVNRFQQAEESSIPDAADRSGGGPAAGGEAGGATRPARQRGGGIGAGGARSGGAGQRESDAAHPGGRRGVRDARRDQRHDAPRLRRAARRTHDVAVSLCATSEPGWLHL